MALDRVTCSGEHAVNWLRLVDDHGPRQKGEYSVLSALAKFADNQTGRCWPSVATLADLTRMTERGVRMILRRLEAKSWIETECRRGRGHTNDYRLVRSAFAPAALEAAARGRARAPKIGKGCRENRKAFQTELRRELIDGGGRAHAREAATDHDRAQCDGAPASEAAPGGERKQAEKMRAGEAPPDPRPAPDGEPGRAGNAPAVEAAPPADPEELEELTEAATVEKLGRSPRMGDAEDRLEVAKWGRDLGLTHAEQLEVIRDAMRTRRAGERVIYLRYFRAAMARYAKAKAEKLDADKLAPGTTCRGAGGGRPSGGGRKGRKTLGELMAGAMAHLDGPPALQARVYGRDF